MGNDPTMRYSQEDDSARALDCVRFDSLTGVETASVLSLTPDWR
jgi:hypothetical protein